MDQNDNIEEAGLEELKLRISQSKAPILQIWLTIISIVITLTSLFMIYLNNSYNEASKAADQQISLIITKINREKGKNYNKALDELSEEISSLPSEYNNYSDNNWKSYGKLVSFIISISAFIGAVVSLYLWYKREKLYTRLRKLEHHNTKVN